MVGSTRSFIFVTVVQKKIRHYFLFVSKVVGIFLGHAYRHAYSIVESGL